MSSCHNLGWEPLEALLTQEITLYTQLEALMTQKKQLIIEGDVPALLTLDKTLLSLTQQIRDRETQRHQLVEETPFQGKKLQECALMLPKAQAKKALDMRSCLLRLIASVEELNQHNQKLLELSIQWIESTVKTLASAMAPESASYNARGDKASQKSHASVLIRPSTVECSA